MSAKERLIEIYRRGMSKTIAPERKHKTALEYISSYPTMTKAGKETAVIVDDGRSKYRLL